MKLLRNLLTVTAVALMMTQTASADLILGTVAGPSTVSTNFTSPLTINGLTNKPDLGGDILTIGSDIVFTDVNGPAAPGNGNVNVNQNQIIVSTGGSTTDRVRTNFVRRGALDSGTPPSNNQGQFYGLTSSDDSGNPGGFGFAGFSNINELGITDALTGQTSDTFRYEMVITNNAALGVSDTTNFTVTSRILDSAGGLLLDTGSISGRDLTGLFGSGVATYDVGFGTFFTSYIDSTTISNGEVHISGPSAAVVPEPSSVALIGLVGGLVALRRRK